MLLLTGQTGIGWAWRKTRADGKTQDKKMKKMKNAGFMPVFFFDPEELPNEKFKSR